MIGALARFEAVRRLRWPPLAFLVTVHPAAVALAHRLEPPHAPGLGDDVAWLGARLAWLFLLTFEIGRDRGLGFDALLTPGLLAPGAYVAGKLLGTAAVLAAYHGALLGVALLASGDRAASVAALGETVAPLPPLLAAVLLVEIVSTTRIPMAYVTVGGAAGLTAAFAAGADAETVAAWAGIGEAGGAARAALLGLAGLALLAPLATRRAAGSATRGVNGGL